MRKYVLFVTMLLAIALGGCLDSSSDGGSAPSGSSGGTHFFGEFSDVPVPNELSIDSKDTFITYSTEGIKLGTQRFSGRVDMASLVGAMKNHMQREGWTLRSVFRSSPNSIMIFEKPDRMCSFYISDGIIFTSMLVFVSPKLQEGALQYSVPSSTSTAPVSGDPVIGSTAGSSSNVTVYPAK